MSKVEKYRKKPVVVEAIQWTHDNKTEIDDFCKQNVPFHGTSGFENGWLLVGTLEGSMRAEVGDWIIKGVKGEFYPCKPDIFAQTYEKVEENA